MKRMTWLSGMSAAVFFWCGTSVLADEVAAPWGTIHANNAGAQSSNHASVTFDTAAWSSGAVLSWQLPPVPGGVDRTGFRASITFDEDGNLYWKPINSLLLASVNPSGMVRWFGHDAVGNINLGAIDQASVVVGDGGASGRCYCTGISAGEGAIFAFRKSDGLLQWSTSLPGSTFVVGSERLTPVLFGGKLYVMGRQSGGTANVYRLDSASGMLEQTTPVSGISVHCNGQMAFVADAFGAGLHGLYFNGDSNSGTDSIPEMYGVQVSSGATPASLAWSSDGGKAGRSHVIYSATTGRLYTHTWNDYGAEFYSWSPMSGLIAPNQNCFNDGHGFYDVGSLDFNGTDVIAGAFTGHFIRYHDTGTGATTDADYVTQDWFGEPRTLGGLYRDASGHSIMVSGTNSRVNDCPPGEGPPPCTNRTARVIALDATTATDVTAASSDGPIYIDNLRVTAGASGTENVVFDVNSFSGYGMGGIPGADNLASGGTGAGTWSLDNAPPSGVTAPDVIADPTGGGMGNVLHLDAASSCGGWQGAFLEFPNAVSDNVVIVSFDQWRADTGDNVWLADHPNFDGWWAIQWDSAFPNIPRGGAFPRQFEPDGGAVQLTPGIWQHVRYIFDFGNGEVRVEVAGTLSPPAFLDIFGLEGALRGVDFEIEGTLINEQAPIPPTPLIFEWDTGAVADHAFTVRGGPLLGPLPSPEGVVTQQIYYFNGQTRNLVAIKPAAVPLTIVAANPPAPSGNPYQPGQPYTDALDTSAGTPTSALTAGIGAGGTPGQGSISYAPIQVTFNNPVTFVTADVTISCTRAPCPSVMSASSSGSTTTINLTAAIPPLGCTSLTFTGGQRVQYRSHPGDPTLDNSSATTDLLAIVTAINNGTANTPGNLGRYNIDRTGGVNTQDLLREVQLLNGVNTTNVFATAGPADACPP